MLESMISDVKQKRHVKTQKKNNQNHSKDINEYSFM